LIEAKREIPEYRTILRRTKRIFRIGILRNETQDKSEDIAIAVVEGLEFRMT